MPLLVLLPLLAACGSGDAETDVEVDPPALSNGERSACRDLLDSLPVTLAGETARAVRPAGAPAAAWGDPAIVLTCGAGVPDTFDELSGCAEVNGVGWYVPEDQADGEVDATFTAVGYRPVVALAVPTEYLPEGGAAALAELAEPVRSGLELVDECR